MGKYKFTMRTTNPNKEGLYAVMLEVSKLKKRSYLSLKIHGDPQYWDDTQERFVIEKGLRSKEAKEKNEERKKNNYLIERYNQRAIDILRKFEDEKVDWTLNQFKEAFTGKIRQGKFHFYILEHIKTLRETGHTGNANCYQNLEHILSIFDNKIQERVFGEIDYKYVKKFDVFLQKRKNESNTRRYYMKSLRAIVNKAIKDGEATRTTYPFGKDGFKISELDKETAKRYLPNEYLVKLKTSKSSREVREYARRLFLFSYYCYGMSFIDMAHLKSKNIVIHNNGKYIVYFRQKTKNQAKTKPIQIKITEQIQQLIDELKQFKQPMNDYLLPIVTVDHEGEELYKHITNKRKRYVSYLKDLANEFGFEFNLTSYVSRHTMAMQLQNNSIPRDKISQIMGHNDLKTTITYLDSLDSSVIDEAVKVL